MPFILPFLIIFILLVIGYIAYDPFKVLRHYETYSISDINLNRDYISTEILLNNYKSENYNSFIFGSSRAMGYNPKIWKEYLQEGSVPYSFDAYSESIFGIYRKLLLLDTLNIPIKNVLILADPDSVFFSVQNSPYALSRKHPLLLGNSVQERASFQLSQFGAYMQAKFFIPYYLSKWGAKGEIASSYRPKRRIEISYPENWMNSPEWEKQTYEEDYYDDPEFIRNNQETDLQTLIGTEQKELLENIRQILQNNNTNYKIIINPLYSLDRLNSEDIKSLGDIFEKKHIYDFSGKNMFTLPVSNYFDRFHFKPQVGDSIFRIIYFDELQNTQ